MEYRESKWGRWVAPAMVVSAAAFAPFSISRGGVHVQVAQCQSGTCCPEERTMCIIGTSEVPDHYFKESGSCKVPPPDQ